MPDFDFVLRFLNITFMDLALSGDNAIVIGMAAAYLPAERRRWAILVGGALAILLRVALTSIATLLTLIPMLSAVGGLVLVWVVWKLLALDAEAIKGEEATAGAAAKGFRQAITLIITADFMMSLDNVIAIAGSAHGSIPLIVAGLIISMPLLMMTGGFISSLIDRAKWLVYAGAAAISFTAARMIFEDRAVEARFPVSDSVVYPVSGAFAILAPLACVFIRDYLGRRRKRGITGRFSIDDRNTPSGEQEE